MKKNKNKYVENCLLSIFVITLFFVSCSGVLLEKDTEKTTSFTISFNPSRLVHKGSPFVRLVRDDSGGYWTKVQLSVDIDGLITAYEFRRSESREGLIHITLSDVRIGSSLRISATVFGKSDDTNDTEVLIGYGESGFVLITQAETYITIHAEELVMVTLLFGEGTLPPVSGSIEMRDGRSSVYIKKGRTLSQVGIRDPYLADFAFLGWYENDSFEVPFAPETAITQNLELYACWASSKKLLSVYVDGSDGNDLNNGTQISPVKSFARAKSLLVEKGEILIAGKITIDNTQSWSLIDKGSALVKRSKEFSGGSPYKDALIEVVAGGSLALENITLDGCSEEVLAGESMIIVAAGGFLEVKTGAVLQNNRTTTSGGAIKSYGKTILSGGTLRGNNAACGGGIAVLGEFEFASGLITENTTDISSSSRGGGIYILDAKKIDITGGEISKNKSYNGGGMSVELSSSVSVAIIKNCEIKQNISTNLGGGLYVKTAGAQEVVIDSVTIKANESSGTGAGGMQLESGTVTLCGSTKVAENTITSGDGGGIAVKKDATLNLKDAILIKDNKHSSNQNNLFVANTGTKIQIHVLGVLKGTAGDIGLNLRVTDSGTVVAQKSTDSAVTIDPAKFTSDVGSLTFGVDTITGNLVIQ